MDCLCALMQHSLAYKHRSIAGRIGPGEPLAEALHGSRYEKNEQDEKTVAQSSDKAVPKDAPQVIHSHVERRLCELPSVAEDNPCCKRAREPPYNHHAPAFGFISAPRWFARSHRP